MDILGAVLQFAITLLFFGSLILSQQTEQLNPYIIVCIGISLILTILFIYVERNNINHF